MKKMIVLAAVAACLNAVAGVGATTNWVAKYVAAYVGNAISNILSMPLIERYHSEDRYTAIFNSKPF